MHEFFDGAIVAWSGLLSSIPRGWTVCDGTNGTPDLRSRFIRGARPGKQPGQTGGLIAHEHDATGDGHFHTRKSGQGVGDPVGIDDTSTVENITFKSELQFNIPPFFELIYIMEWEGW